MKAKKIIYYIVTGLLSLMMLASAGNMLINLSETQGMFQALGFPNWIPMPLAILKVLGVAAIWIRKSTMLREWAYAGFFFNACLALAAHLTADDHQFAGALAAIILIIISRFLDPQVFYKRQSIL